MFPSLTPTPFDAGKHWVGLQDFYCGEELYAREIADWIKSSEPEGVLDELKKRPDLCVWIYTLDDDTIVGYGALLKEKWELEGTNRKVPIVLISNVGMRKAFHGQPKGVESPFDKYSSQILRHLIRTAKTRHAGIRWLGLYVHPENLPAIKLYVMHEFQPVKGVWYNHPDFLIRYPAMILDLSRVRFEGD
jgi:Acetyltransferase (GNAT) family